MAVSTRFWRRATIGLVAVATGAAALATFLQDDRAPEPRLALPSPAASTAPTVAIPPAASIKPAATSSHADTPPQVPTAKIEEPLRSAESASSKPGNQTTPVVEPPPAPPGPSTSASAVVPALPPVQSLDDERPPAPKANPGATAVSKVSGSTDRAALSSDQAGAGSAPAPSTEAPARRSKLARRNAEKKARSRPAPFPIREFFAFRP